MALDGGAVLNCTQGRDSGASEPRPREAIGGYSPEEKVGGAAKLQQPWHSDKVKWCPDRGFNPWCAVRYSSVHHMLIFYIFFGPFLIIF
jgi:hypothetical protein